MKKIFGLAVATACLMSMAAIEASAWERKSSATGPRGFSRSVESSGGCSGGSCTHNRSVTGPAGNTRTRSRTVTEGDSGAGWSRSGSVTGPNGGTVTYGGSGSCSGGSCTYSGGATGPNGGTVTRSGTVTRY